MGGFVIWNTDYGYYNGQVLRDVDMSYPASSLFKTDSGVKIYTSEKRAINSAEKIKAKCEFFNDYIILPY